MLNHPNPFPKSIQRIQKWQSRLHNQQWLRYNNSHHFRRYNPNVTSTYCSTDAKLFQADRIWDYLLQEKYQQY